MVRSLVFTLALANAARPDCGAYLTDVGLRLGGDVNVRFRSREAIRPDPAAWAAHLPGAELGDAPDAELVTHRFAREFDVTRRGRHVDVEAPWRDDAPADLPHLLYGTARRAWLKRQIFPVHAACVGDAERGYVLLVGAAGAGKTSIALDAVRRGAKLFSGDKTLVRVDAAGRLEAIAGTRALTVRAGDEWRWRDVPKVDAVAGAERLTFHLSPAAYAPTARVPIRAVYLVQLNEGVETLSELSKASALHTLYPLFTDQARADVLIGGDRALLDGTLKPKRRQTLIRALARGLERTPVRRLVGSLDFVGRTLAPPPPARGPKRVVLGICGIGNGHLNRQLPVLEHLLARGDRVMVFAYGESLRRLRATHADRATIVEVANPYFVGTPAGLDFARTAAAEVNRVDFLKINATALDRATREFGRPDLVVSDYEMVSAQLAYARGAPLITLDQQSKFLAGDLPPDLRGTSARDEVQRLNMFFPRAEERLVASFFKLPPGAVRVLPPMIRAGVEARRGTPPSARPSVYVYISAQRFAADSPEDAFLRMAPDLPKDYDFHVFWPQRRALPASTENVFFRHHGPGDADDRLAEAHAVITTAGHTLISEAMFLQKPVLAMPLPLYEQQLNAHVVEANGFGLDRPHPTLADVTEFLKNVPRYARAIRDDKNVLFHESGNARVLERIEAVLAR